MKLSSAQHSLLLAGVFLVSRASARLGTSPAADDESAAASAIAAAGRRRLDILENMFSGMIDDANRVISQLQEQPPAAAKDAKDFDLSSLMDLMSDFDFMGGGDLSGDKFASIADAMTKPVNFTDLYDRCCPSSSDAAVLPGGMTQYDTMGESSCKCPVRNVEPYKAKWNDKCVTSVGPKALAELSGASTPKTGMELFFEAMGGMGGMGSGEWDTGGLGESPFGDAFGELMDSIFGPANYTDIYGRCCSSNSTSPSEYDLDPSACSCPVRNSSKFAAKWEEQCATKIAAKAAEERNGDGDHGDTGGGSVATGETAGGGMDLGSLMGGDLDLESLFESFFGKSVNYTQVYDNCCESDPKLFATAYDADAAACRCPVRQSNPKWTTACADKIIPRVKL